MHIVDSSSLEFLALPRHKLESVLRESFNMKPYRAQQLFRWVYKSNEYRVEHMTDIAKKHRVALSEQFTFSLGEIEQVQVSKDGTRKYLIRVSGGSLVEAVMIKQPDRMTLCVSSQVGCGMACAFCKTGTMGFIKHLKTEEIIQQVLAVMKDSTERWNDMFTNMVFMGMGEPFHNLDNVLNSINILVDPQGLGFAPKRITVSTSGLVPAIERFGIESKANLAVSLNATTDEVRDWLMPVNKKYNIEKLLKSLHDYPHRKRKKLTIEYVLLAGVNDSDEDMKRLPKLLDGLGAKVNLIPYNDNAGLGFKSPSRNRVHKWVQYLAGKGMAVTVRWSKGQDISAACGQLATEVAAKKRKSTYRAAAQA